MPEPDADERREYLRKRAEALSDLAKVYAELARLDGTLPSATIAPVAQPSTPDQEHLRKSLQRLPLDEAIVEYLRTCKKPQTIAEIHDAVRKAGRAFEAKDTKAAIKDALRKGLVKNDDLFQVRWSRWHLKSLHSKASLRKIAHKNATFGTAGRDPTEHARRTSEAMQAKMAAGEQYGAPLKMSAEKLGEAQEMLQSTSAIKVAEHFNVSVPLIYSLFKITRANGKRTVALRERAIDRVENFVPNADTSEAFFNSNAKALRVVK